MKYVNILYTKVLQMNTLQHILETNRDFYAEVSFHLQATLS